MFGGALPQIFHQTIRSLVTGCFPRTLSVIAKWYAPEDLIGKHLCIVANLAPRPMMKGKYVSEGMIVSAEDDEGNVTVLQLPETVKPGAQLC